MQQPLEGAGGKRGRSSAALTTGQEPLGLPALDQDAVLARATA
jgi:hypothetical protein